MSLLMTADKNKDKEIIEIRGSGAARRAFGKGGEGGTPFKEQPNTLYSRNIVRIVEVLSEGEIEGPVNGLQSVFLDSTPVLNPDQKINFKGFEVLGFTGFPEQPGIEGDTYTETLIPLGVLVTNKLPVTRTISGEYNSCTVRIGIPNLTESIDDPKAPELRGASVHIAFDLRTGDGSFVEVVDNVIRGKTTSNYERAYKIELPKTPSNTWYIRMRRKTADNESIKISNNVYWNSYSLLVENNFSYPNCAYVTTQADSEQFGSSVPTRSFDIKGIRVLIPSNYYPEQIDHRVGNSTPLEETLYDPETEMYTKYTSNDNREARKHTFLSYRESIARFEGEVYKNFFDGTFKTAWTNNPAWVLYDILTNKRYGLGNTLSTENIDIVDLYQIAKYCDEPVEDGFGNYQPRFTFNAVINQEIDAYSAINAICSNMRCMPYWGSGVIRFSQDRPKDTAQILNESNVIGGIFNYASSAEKSRHSAIYVSWNDPDDEFRATTEVVEDPDLIQRYGYRRLDTVAFGCTSRGQAYRYGKWMLETEKNEREVVTYQTSFDGAFIRPGDIVEIADSHYAGSKFGGRVKHSNINIGALGYKHGNVLSAVGWDGMESVEDQKLYIPDIEYFTDNVSVAENGVITLNPKNESSRGGQGPGYYEFYLDKIKDGETVALGITLSQIDVISNLPTKQTLFQFSEEDKFGETLSSSISLDIGVADVGTDDGETAFSAELNGTGVKTVPVYTNFNTVGGSGGSLNDFIDAFLWIKNDGGTYKATTFIIKNKNITLDNDNNPSPQYDENTIEISDWTTSGKRAKITVGAKQQLNEDVQPAQISIQDFSAFRIDEDKQPKFNDEYKLYTSVLLDRKIDPAITRSGGVKFNYADNNGKPNQRDVIEMYNNDTLLFGGFTSNWIRANAMWNLSSPTLTTRKWRVISMSEDSSDKNVFEVVALAYDETKFDRVEKGHRFDTAPVTLIPDFDPTRLTRPTEMTVNPPSHPGTITFISWDVPRDPRVYLYRFQYRKSRDRDTDDPEDNSGWENHTFTVSAPSIELKLDNGTYDFRVFSLARSGIESEPFTLNGNVVDDVLGGDTAHSGAPRSGGYNPTNPIGDVRGLRVVEGDSNTGTKLVWDSPDLPRGAFIVKHHPGNNLGWIPGTGNDKYLSEQSSYLWEEASLLSDPTGHCVGTTGSLDNLNKINPDKEFALADGVETGFYMVRSVYWHKTEINGENFCNIKRSDRIAVFQHFLTAPTFEQLPNVANTMVEDL